MTPDSHLDVPAGEKAIRRGLDDFMWIEILSRLSSTNHVFQCKCVSKRWNSLTSNRYFIRRFIDHHSEKYGSEFNEELLLFFHYYSWNNKDGMGILACSSDRKGTKQEDLSLSTYKVESSYNDLLVCSKIRSLTYYIVNPFTKDHVKLPKYDSDGLYHGMVGFVCEPFYRHGGRQFDLVPNYRYRVIRIIDSNRFGDCRIEIYCSEKKQWNLLIGLDRFRHGCVSNVVAYGGKLYWYNFSREVVAYDPFVESDEPDFKFFGLNVTQTYETVYLQLAQSQGSLLLMQLTTHNQASYMSIWKLEEEEAGHGDCEAFCFERTVAINDIISDTSLNFIRRVVDNGNTLLVLGVHPSNRDVIFLGYEKSPHVASYNLVTKEWQEVGEIEHIADDIDFLIHKFGVSVNLPWWPTPVH